METQNGVPGQLEKVCIKKIRRKRQKLLIIELFFDFAKNTTLHGLRYVTERGVSLVEKIFWFTTFSMSVALCFFLISKVWMKWQTYPVMVSFSEQMVPVSKVPFPSVTICPQSKCLQSKYNFTDALIKYRNSSNTNNNDPEYLTATRKLNDVNILCTTFHVEDLLPYQYHTLLNSSLIDHIEQVSPTVEDMFYSCKWRGTEVECTSFFNKVLTAEGVCYNFNSLAADEIFKTENIQKDYSYLDTKNKIKDWNLLEGYIFSDNSSEQYPFRGGENGAEPDFEVELQEKISDRDLTCNIVKNGYKIYLHHPTDLPHSSLYYYAALAGQTSSLALKFNMVYTSKNLKEYDPDVRQCYFPSERSLRYFRQYTENNCMLECQANLTYENCGCVWFNMPHNNSQEICTMGQIQCMKTAKANIAMMGLAQTCQCLPLCDNIKYDADILKTDFNKKALMSALKIVYGKLDEYEDEDEDNENDDIEYSKIEIYFKAPTFVSTRRSELFGLTDFLANCGGLLGLFLGFSFLSLVEIFYFLTLRLFCIMKKDLRQERKSLTSTTSVTS